MHVQRESDRDLSVLEHETLQLYEAGRYISAYNHVRKHGGLGALEGPTGRALAGRLASNLGAPRYGSSIHLRAWRRTPDANALGYFIAMERARCRGPVHALEFLDSISKDELTPAGISDVASAQAYLFAVLKDFKRADDALARALDARPDRPWLHVTEGNMLQFQDRLEQALSAFRRALEIRPFYRPAVQSFAAGLIQLDRVDAARTLLIEACEQLECGALFIQLAHLERELSMYELARSRMEAAMPLLPLWDRDRNAKQEYTGFAATLAYDVGEIDEALRLAKQTDHKFFKTFAENLEKNRATGRRVVLDVGFTRQHDVTCVPATLSTLSKFWAQPVEHLEVAEEICYDGTPAHAERAWLEDHGFFCREFTLDWNSAVALIDAGLPFTQTLTGYTMAHMQAVIGYDSRSGVLIYRDPSVRHSGEVLGKELLEHQRSMGPRGMVFVPQSERKRVETIDLPDHELWTLSHRVSSALAAHRRDEALAACQMLQESAGDHRLTIHAQARIAAYDGDLRMLGKLTDQLLEEFPDDQNQWSVKLRVLRQLGTRADRLQVLEKLCQKADCEMIYRHQLVDELLNDPHEHLHVDYLLRRSMRANPIDPQTLTLQARREWIHRNRNTALDWYRYAACLETRNDDRSMSYFHAACALNRTDEALAMLRDRFERFRSRHGGPGRSLAHALDLCFKTREAQDILRQAMEARPNDGDLQLFACQFWMRIGRLDTAERQLDAAKNNCHEAEWLAIAAQLAQQRGQLELAYEYVQKSLQRLPLSIATHRHAVEVLADLRGVDVAVDQLAAYVERFPLNLELRALLVETTAELGADKAAEAARKHLALHPEDAWCWRELGFKLVEQRQWQEARAAADQAERYEPQAMQQQMLRGVIDVGEGNESAARDHFLQAIKISVDYSAALIELIRLCDTQRDRRQVAKAVLEEMKRQVTAGETLLMFRAFAAQAFEPEEALAIVKEAQAARPDLWQAWSAVVAQLVAMKRLEEALAEAKAAAKQFPLLPVIWSNLANVYFELGKPDNEIKALRRALAINSRNGATLRSLAEAYQRAGDGEREEAILKRACASEPRNVTHRGALADCYWRHGKRELAIDAIREAIEKEPAYGWGWDRLAAWAYVVNRPNLLVDVAEAITDARPQSLHAWLQRADILERFPEQSEARLAAIERALEIDPRSIDAHERRAYFLANHGRFNAAIAACAPEVFGGRQPLQLQTRATMIEYQRGDRGAAIARMRKVVEVDPHYAYARSQLATWLDEGGQQQEALECAKELLRIAPYAPASWGYVAQCLLNNGQRDEAKTHLRRSLELDASYSYGGQTLLQLLSDDGEYDEALRTLRLISPHLSEYELAATEARLQTLAGREDEALAALRVASRLTAQQVDSLLSAVDQMLLKGWAESVKKVIREEIDAHRGSPQTVSALVEVLAREAKLGEIERLCESMEDASDRWVEAIVAYIEALGDAEAIDRADAFIAPRADALSRQTRTWWSVGYALQHSGHWYAAVDWMSDWRTREDAEPHHFVSLVLSLLSVGDAGCAKEVVDHVLTLPICPATDALRVLGASAEVLLENPAAAIAQLEQVTPHALPPYYASLYVLHRTASQAALEIAQGGRWRRQWKLWLATEKEHRPVSNDQLFQYLVLRSRLLLVRQRGNIVRTWLLERECRRALSQLLVKADTMQRQYPLVRTAASH